MNPETICKQSLKSNKQLTHIMNQKLEIMYPNSNSEIPLIENQEIFKEL